MAYRLPNIVYDPKHRTWRIPAVQYNEVQEALQSVPGLEVNIHQMHAIPQKVLGVSRRLRPLLAINPDA